MRTDKAWRVAEGYREIFCNGSLDPGIADKRGKVITDNFGHAGSTESNHLRLVKSDAVLQAVDQIVHPAEYRCVLGHRRRDGRRRLFEMAAEMTAEIRVAAL
ncbi:hypothetical protein D3C73_700980 [compost metagenome]